jgi:hypothetical protein
MFHGVETAGGEHGNQLRRWNTYAGTDSATGALDWRHFQEWTPFMEAANVGFLVSRAPLDLTSAADGRPLAGIRLVHDGALKVYRNDRALPRAYLAAEARVVAGADAALRVMRSPAWDPRRLAVVEPDAADRGARAALAALAPAASVGPPGTARVLAHAPEHVVVRTDAARPALLVLADNLSAGWTATVDGRPAPVLRANVTLRGVVVPPGRHDVAFTYRTPGLRAGAALSAAAALLLAAGALGVALRARGGDA